MTDTAGALLSAIVGDVMGALEIPGGALLGEAIKAVMKRRMDAAREVLLDELRRGDKTLMDAELEEAAAILWRYQRAAQEGAARTNLRLLARVIAGQAHMGNLKADEFLYYADILSSLRREEILVLGIVWKHLYAHPERTQGGTNTMAAIVSALSEAVPSVYASEEEYRAAFSALARTGLIQPGVGGGGIGSGGGMLLHHFTPLMHRLTKLISLEGLGD